MKIFNDHPHEFQVTHAFERFRKNPKKVVFFELRCGYGSIHSFHKIRNTVHKALIVSQHGRKSPTIIKLVSPLEGKDDQLKMVICPDHREVALYVKSGDYEYADYFHPKFCKNSQLWAMFELDNGVYGLLFDSTKYKKIDFGFQFVSENTPNPFDLMSMGLKPTFKFDHEK